MSKLSVYQGACLALGERRLLSPTENRESRRALDDIWARDGVGSCLQMGLWNFAMRTIQYDYSPSVEPDFGYQRAFDKPTDWVRTAALCEDEFFKVPLLRYVDEAAYWYADLDTIYVRYVSNDTSYGFDYSKWPQNFTRFVELYFAWSVCERVTGSAEKKRDLERDMEIAKRQAKSTDAMDEATAFPPPGSWVRARQGKGRDLERGSRTQLIG